MTLKSEAFAPESATRGEPVRLSAAVPVFSMVKLRELRPVVAAALPKSVPSVVEGVVLPLAMTVELPLTLMSGSTGGGQSERPPPVAA